MSKDIVQIFDTTRGDGEQVAGCKFNDIQKITTATNIVIPKVFAS